MCMGLPCIVLLYSVILVPINYMKLQCIALYFEATKVIPFTAIGRRRDVLGCHLSLLSSG